MSRHQLKPFSFRCKARDLVATLRAVALAALTLVFGCEEEWVDDTDYSDYVCYVNWTSGWWNEYLYEDTSCDSPFDCEVALAMCATEQKYDPERPMGAYFECYCEAVNA